MASGNLIQLNKGSKAYGARILFDSATFAVNDGEHIGVIGPNGAGKTTMFKILCDKESLDSGGVVKSQSLRMGYLEQEDSWDIDDTVESHLENNCTLPIWELKQFGTKLGLDEEKFQSTVATLSGGYRMRVKLLYLIGQEPNLLLLDEPTNFLDLETLLVLENFLQSYRGAFLLISHDREFLKRTTDHTLEVEGTQITKYPGNIDDYFEQKALLREIMQKRSKNLEAQRKEVLDFANKFRAKATKAKQVQSRLKSLGKMESIDLSPLPISAKIHIPKPLHTGKETLALHDANLGYGELTVLRDVELILKRGDHVAIVGFNGAGKSTMLKTLAGEIPLLKGELKEGHQVRIGYYAQHVSEALDPNDSVLDALERKAHADVEPREIKTLAGSLLFSGDDIHKKIRVLSGGEKSRVALGQILLQKAPCLLLDEPTNHLDFDTVEAMTRALGEFQGTVVVVSHDRSFIKRVATKIVEIENGQALVYHGSYDEYVWSVQKGVLSEIKGAELDDSPQSGENSTRSKKKGNYKATKKNLEKAIRTVKKNLSESESTQAELDRQILELSDALQTSQGEKAQTLSIEINELQDKKFELEEEYLHSIESLEQKQKELQSLTNS